MDGPHDKVVDPAALPDDVSVLKQTICSLLEALRRKELQIDQLEHRLDLLLRRLYGRRSCWALCTPWPFSACWVRG